MDVVNIRETPEQLESVKRLAALNGRTLGFFPDDAFEQHAAKGQILVAVECDSLCGYLLFRHVTTRNLLSITHLCVANRQRRRGIARSLVDALKPMARGTRGIALWCRRDYAANELWPKLGFVLRDEKPGRGRDGALLNLWWFEPEEASLFDSASLESASLLVVAIDANVFFDLEDRENPPSESSALRADWLQEHIEICVTAELRNEIIRNPDEDRRRSHRATLTHYRELLGDDDDFRGALEQVNTCLGAATGPRAESDRRHIARACAGGADFLITRDERLLARAPVVLNAIGLPIMRPSQLLREIDELLRSMEYEPRRVAGSSVVSADRPRDPDEIARTFLACDRGEKLPEFRRTLTDLASKPREARVDRVRDPSGRDAALIGIDTADTPICRIRVLRVLESRLAPTFARQLLEMAAHAALSRGALITVVDDRNVSAPAQAALVACGYRRCDDVWMRPQLKMVASSTTIAATLRERAPELGDMGDHLRLIAREVDAARQQEDQLQLLRMERILRPAKFTDLLLPCYVVPIRPQWAMHLFDEDLAARNLFSDRPDLAFRRENVYYRAARPGIGNYPARLLWYVSQSQEAGTGAIRATAYLDEVVVGPATDIYRRFERLGIYEWHDVLSTARGDPRAKLMALRFSDSECLGHHVSYRAFSDLLLDSGAQMTTIQAPISIQPTIFFKVYQKGNE